MSKIFVSYSRHDQKIAEKLSLALRSRNIEVFVDYKNMVATDNFPQKLAVAVRESDCLLLLLSTNSTNSKWVQREVQYADFLEKQIIIVRLDNAALPDTLFFLAYQQQLDLRMFDQREEFPVFIIDNIIDSLKLSLMKNSSQNPTEDDNPKRVKVMTPAKVEIMIEFGYEYTVFPTDPGFASFTFTGINEFNEHNDSAGNRVLYKSTETAQSKVTAKWTPRIIENGQYEISAYIPKFHSTTENARYKIHGTSIQGEGMVVLNQKMSQYPWVSLGIHSIDKSLVNPGVVFLNDLTGENNREIAFSGMRWRLIVNFPEALG
jgi:hypothetical protein